MSSILKALRKVEDDKASLGEGSVDLAHDILKGNYEQAKPSVSFLQRTSVVILSLVSVALSVWLLAIYEPVAPSLSVDPLRIEVGRSAVHRIEQSEVVLEQEAPVVVDDASAALPIESQAQVNSKDAIELPQLQVEDIVYHSDSTSRMAIINGLPVMEGTAIEGVLIEKIYPDRVQFSSQGVRFNKFKKSVQ